MPLPPPPRPHRPPGGVRAAARQVAPGGSIRCAATWRCRQPQPSRPSTTVERPAGGTGSAGRPRRRASATGEAEPCAPGGRCLLPGAPPAVLEAANGWCAGDLTPQAGEPPWSGKAFLVTGRRRAAALRDGPARLSPAQPGRRAEPGSAAVSPRPAQQEFCFSEEARCLKEEPA